MKFLPSKRIVEGMRILFQFLPLSTYGGVPEDVPPPRPPRGDGIQAGMRSKLMEEVEMDLETVGLSTAVSAVKCWWMDELRMSRFSCRPNRWVTRQNASSAFVWSLWRGFQDGLPGDSNFSRFWKSAWRWDVLSGMTWLLYAIVNCEVKLPSFPWGTC